MERLTEYVAKLGSASGVSCGVFITFINFWVFPDKTLQYAALAVLATMVLDIITKYASISKAHGGYRKARNACAISSQKFWEGTSAKLGVYAVIVILAGLSYRITPLEMVGQVFSGVAYGSMWWREVQSIGENMDIDWLKMYSKKKQEEMHGKAPKNKKQK